MNNIKKDLEETERVSGIKGGSQKFFTVYYYYYYCCLHNYTWHYLDLFYLHKQQHSSDGSQSLCQILTKQICGQNNLTLNIMPKFKSNVAKLEVCKVNC